MPVSGNSPLPLAPSRNRLASGLRHERFRLIALKLGILMITRLPDVKPPCLTRRALGPGFFFRAIPCSSSTYACVGRSAAGGSHHADIHRLMWNACDTTCIFGANQDDVFRSPPSHSPSGSAQDAAPGRFGARGPPDRIAGQALARFQAVRTADRLAGWRYSSVAHQFAALSQYRRLGPAGERFHLSV